MRPMYLLVIRIIKTIYMRIPLMRDTSTQTILILSQSQLPSYLVEHKWDIPIGPLALQAENLILRPS